MPSGLEIHTHTHIDILHSMPNFSLRCLLTVRTYYHEIEGQPPPPKPQNTKHRGQVEVPNREYIPGTPSVLFLLGNFTPKTSN